jgi:uncharacterized membrane protein YuzA (DUF378 family)
MERIKELRAAVRIMAAVPGILIGREIMGLISPAKGAALVAEMLGTLLAGYGLAYVVIGIVAVVVEYWND